MPPFKKILVSDSAKPSNGQATAAPQTYSKVPTLVGLPIESAVDLLRARKLRMVVRAEKPSETVAKGVILEQEPLPESELVHDSEVVVVVSSGAEEVAVPEIRGKKIEDAKKALEEAGISVGEISQTGSGEPGTVSQVIPMPGTALEKGATVSLVVVPSTIEVPNLLGKRTAQAKKLIEEAGFKGGKIRWRYNEDRPANLVLGQEPKPGATAEIGSEISLVLNEE
jgi:serine/threonine-protein kinase